MNRSKVLIAMCMVVLGVTAVSASAAQAASPNWWINGAELEAGKSENVKSEGGPFGLNVPELGLEVVCKKEVNTGTIIGGNPGTDAASITFSECHLVVNGEEVPTTTCEVPNISTNVKTHLFKYNGGIYDAFEPASGTVFTTIVIKGAECAFAGEFPVTGRTVGLDHEATVSKVTHTLEFSEAITKTTEEGTGEPYELKFGEFTAFLTGKSAEVLSGANVGKPWDAQ